MTTETQKKIRSLDSRICRLKKLGREAEAVALINERTALRAGRSMDREQSITRRVERLNPPKRTPKQKQTLTMPASQARSGAKVDTKAIREAMEFLGITRPVIIKWTAGRNRTGTCRLASDYTPGVGFTPFIRITCSGLMNGESISKVLWHELRHAAQMERFETSHHYWNEYKKFGYNGMKYFYNPFEVEARATAREMHDTLPLASGDRGDVNTSAAALNPSEAGW